MRRVVLSAPAKVNLSLAVGPPREDGRHPVETTLLALDLLDRVTLALDDTARGDGIRLAGSGPAWSEDVPRDGRNLAVRAAEVALDLAGRGRMRGRIGIEIEKRIPSRAGLGGGSSDAAAAAVGTALLAGLDPLGADRARLCGALAALGADVPFFLAAADSGLGIGSGGGERVRPLAMPATSRALVLLTPAIGAPTGRVYAALDALRAGDSPRGTWPGPAPPEDPSRCLTLSIERARARLANDLEPAALAAIPGLARLRAALDGAGAGHFRLAGSGASFFGLFEDEDAAHAFLADPRVSRMSRDYGLRLVRAVRPFGSGLRIEAH
ncbi:MAG TPA: 4-(cytidine 5'-diphospho)-2-C-methyl-D-erythritol kinase [Planctomycetes bacterium]|nr:4-(cytidine 5'-diphospho)-2-C-methyl-D-erythritol kinase [Planctomycetota bacterium]